MQKRYVLPLVIFMLISITQVANANIFLNDNEVYLHCNDNEIYNIGESRNHTYVCDDTDAQAYEGGDSDGGFNDGGEVEIDAPGDYDKIKVDDGNYVQDSEATEGDYQYHRFDFTIAEDTSTITRIYIIWRGYGSREASGTRDNSFWVKIEGIWTKITEGSNGLVIETMGYDSWGQSYSISDVISGGHIHFATQSNKDTESTPGGVEKSVLRSYYVEVIISYTTPISMEFEHIVVADDYVQFNTTTFKCDFDTSVNITLSFLNVIWPYGNLTILSFNYTQGQGNSLHEFNITGFQTRQAYWIYTNNTFLIENISDADEGWVNFTSDIYWGQVDIIQYEYIRFSNVTPSNESWLFFNSSGFLTNLTVNYSNFDGSVYVNGTFSWLNVTLDDWEEYDSFNITANQSVVTVVNWNFSAVQETYYWRVYAIANDTGVEHQESYVFKTFYIDTVAERSTAAMYGSFGSMILIPFVWLLGRRKKKRDME